MAVGKPLRVVRHSSDTRFGVKLALHAILNPWEATLRGPAGSWGEWPRGFEEVHARGNLEAHRLQDPSKWVPWGVGAIEGRASGPEVPMLGDGNGGAAAYGPGEEPRPREGEPTALSPGRRENPRRERAERPYRKPTQVGGVNNPR